jgi:hypothetical protein
MDVIDARRLKIDMSAFSPAIDKGYFGHFTPGENTLKTRSARKRILNTGKNSQNFRANSSIMKKQGYFWLL